MLSDMMKKLTSTEYLKNAKRIIVSIIVAGLPILYFGYADTISLEKLLDFKFGVFAVIIAISAWLVSAEAKSWAFDNAYETDEDLEKVSEKVEDNAKTITKKDRKMLSSIHWVAQFNKEKQEALNHEKTQEKIASLEERAITARIKGKEKKVKRIEAKIEKLEKNGLFAKSFEPYKLKEIVTIDTDTNNIMEKLKRKKAGNYEIVSKPKKVNVFVQTFTFILRGATVGLSAIIPFALTESITTIIWFYMMYSVVLVATFTFNYLYTFIKMTSDKMYRSHKNTLARKTNVQEELIDYLDTPVREEEK